MREFESDDYETPIEEFPGYLGYTWDGEFHCGPELAPLEKVDWRELWCAFDEAGISEIEHAVDGQPIRLNVEHSDLAYLLDQIPGFDVQRDNGPPDAGPASGSGYIFTIADGTSLPALEKRVAELVDTLMKKRAELSL